MSVLLRVSEETKKILDEKAVRSNESLDNVIRRLLGLEPVFKKAGAPIGRKKSFVNLQVVTSPSGGESEGKELGGEMQGL